MPNKIPQYDELKNTIQLLSDGLSDKKEVYPTLTKLRSLVGDLDLTTLWTQTDAKVFTVLYLTRHLINDVWANLCTDALFELPPPSVITPFAKELGLFLKVVLFEDRFDEGMAHLSTTINEYYRVIETINECAKSVDRIIWMDDGTIERCR